MKIGDEVYIHGYIDEIRKDTIIIKNDGGYFGTVQKEISVNPQPKTGHWKPTIVRGSESYICSECSAECCYVTTNYCPSCGVKMVETQERSDKE